MPGPPPARSSERRRRNKVEVDRAPNTAGPRGPVAPEWVQGLARDWYDSLRTSGQSVWYTDSDWTSALIVCRAISAFEAKPAAHMLTAILSSFGSLAVTEGDRRRLRIELERAQADEAEDAAVTEIDGWRERRTS